MLKRNTPMKRSGFKQKTLEEVKELQKLRQAKSSLSKGRSAVKTTKGLLKKPKKLSVAKLKKEADKYFSIYVRMRDSDKDGNLTCITCPDTKPWKMQQNGHFVTRACNALRYDELNNNGQCVGCNVFKNGNLFEYSLALDMKYGDGTAKRLHARRFETHKLTVDELQTIIANAKEYISAHSN